jgi:hypothetical protein
MAQKDRDLESRKIITAMRADALGSIIHTIRRSLENAIAKGVDLDDFQ